MLSPAFILILLGSCLLWYTTKLSYNYTTEMPVNVRIDGKKYRITATVTGRGSQIVAQRLSLKSRLEISLDDLSYRASRETEGAILITPASLARAINAKITNLTIDEVVDAPEFVPAPPEPEEPEESEVDEAEKKEVSVVAPIVMGVVMDVRAAEAVTRAVAEDVTRAVDVVDVAKTATL